MFRIIVKYISGPALIDTPSGSSTPVPAEVLSITVAINLGSNCGSENTQLAFKDLIFSLSSLTRLAPGTLSGETVIEPTGFMPKRSSKY